MYRAGMRKANGGRAPISSVRWMMPIGLTGMLLAAVAGCSGTSASPSLSPTDPSPQTTSPTPTGAVTPSPSPTAAATSAPTATPGAAFESATYPYTFELPAGVLTRQWRPAAVAWDGVSRMALFLHESTDALAVDITGTVDGTLLIWGLTWDGDLAGFDELVRDNAARFHDCHSLGEPKRFEVNGAEGIGQLEACAPGVTGAANTQAIRAVLLKDGYGLAFRLVVDPKKVPVAFDHLVTWMDGLTWEAP